MLTVPLPVLLFCNERQATCTAKGKYEKWLEPDGLLLLEAWARDGLTDEQIAEKIGISRKTLYEWLKKHCNICNAIKKGKEVVDVEVENALLSRAKGCTVTEVTRERALNPDTKKTELVVTKAVTKDIPPDTTALIFWLCNRRPDRWRRADPKDTSSGEEVRIIDDV